MKFATLLVLVMQVVSCILTTTSFAFVAQNKNNNVARRQQSQLYETHAVVDGTLDNPRQTGMALMLDDGTRKSHSMAENTQFVTGFFKGLANRNSYRLLMTTLYYVYKAQEEAMDNTNEARVQILDYPELRRLESLKKDMEFFYGTNWPYLIQPSPAAKEYVARVEEVAATKPYLLVAHQYTRYLGDLFGGQMMGGMARRSLDLPDREGTAFYTFDGIPSAKDFITEWYTRLNGLDLTDEQKVEIVDEANRVFALNILVFQELDGSAVKAMFSLAFNSLKSKLGFS